MKIIIVGSTKGGVGKSTIAINLAAYLAMQGNKVLGVDADKQRSFTNWGTGRLETDLPAFNVIEITEGLLAKLRLIEKENNFDYVIIDVGGFDSSNLRSALIMANIAVVPIIPSTLDLWAYLEGILPVIKQANDMREQLDTPTLKAFMLPSKVSGTNKNLTLLRDFLKNSASKNEIALLKAFIPEAVAYQRCIDNGNDIFHYTYDNGKKNEKAIASFKTFVEEIL